MSASTRSSPAAASPAQASPPTRLGRYHLLERLGTGRTTEVFRALLTGPAQFQRALAIKRLLPERAALPGAVERFAQEANLCGRLTHQNVVQVYELGQQEGQLFVVRELVPGWDLGRIMKTLRRQRRLPPVRVAAEILRQVACGLGHAHALTAEGKASGVIHHGLHPGKVMLARTGVVKILDFEAPGAALPAPGDRTDRWSYLAPEQAGRTSFDHRVDIFACGILLHELLTGRVLFHAETPEETGRLIREMPILAPSRLNPQVPAALDQIALKALARSPEQRWADAGQLADALEGLLVDTAWRSRDLFAFLAEIAASETALSLEPSLSVTASTLRTAAVADPSRPPRTTTAGAKTATLVSTRPSALAVRSLQTPVLRSDRQRLSRRMIGLAVIGAGIWLMATRPTARGRSSASVGQTAAAMTPPARGPIVDSLPARERAPVLLLPAAGRLERTDTTRKTRRSLDVPETPPPDDEAAELPSVARREISARPTTRWLCRSGRCAHHLLRSNARKVHDALPLDPFIE